MEEEFAQNNLHKEWQVLLMNKFKKLLKDLLRIKKYYFHLIFRICIFVYGETLRRYHSYNSLNEINSCIIFLIYLIYYFNI